MPLLKKLKLSRLISGIVSPGQGLGKWLSGWTSMRIGVRIPNTNVNHPALYLPVTLAFSIRACSLLSLDDFGELGIRNSCTNRENP